MTLIQKLGFFTYSEYWQFMQQRKEQEKTSLNRKREVEQSAR